MIANFSKNPKEVSISLDDYYPDDFEIYSEESSQDSPNQSLELVNISYTKNNDKNLEKVSLKIDLDFEKELDFLLNKQIESKTLPILRKNPQSNSDFYTPLLGRRFNGNATNIDDWIEQQTKDLKLSTEYRKSNPYCYFRDQREESPSTEFSYNANKFNYNNPRPTLCDKPIMFSKSLQPPPITAISWAILNGDSNQLICGKNLNKKREIASLTKIMTALVVSQLLERMKLCPYTTSLEISKKASSYQGTSAYLLEGDILTVIDLLHGMMLPSGNDAASCLAENFGIFLFYESFEQKTGKKNLITLPKKGCLNYFLDEMNDCAKKFKLKHTLFANVHGLPNIYNKSTVFDLCKLSFHAIKNEIISSIVKKKIHKVYIKNKFGNNREIEWCNTNKMLDIEGFIGLKTGVTEPAGSCLSSIYRDKKFFLVFVVLGSDSKDERFEDTEKLMKWIKSKLS